MEPEAVVQSFQEFHLVQTAYVDPGDRIFFLEEQAFVNQRQLFFLNPLLVIIQQGDAGPLALPLPYVDQGPRWQPGFLGSFSDGIGHQEGFNRSWRFL